MVGKADAPVASENSIRGSDGGNPQSTVSIYMVPRPDRPLQTWKTFVRNDMEGIASIDLFVVPTIAFQQLFAFLVLRYERR